jgi:hypothetical protein
MHSADETDVIKRRWRTGVAPQLGIVLKLVGILRFEVKTYCVPGNAKTAKRRMAIWVRGLAAK